MSILPPPEAGTGPHIVRGSVANNIVDNMSSELGKMLSQLNKINPLDKRKGERQSRSLKNPPTSEKSSLKHDDKGWIEFKLNIKENG